MRLPFFIRRHRYKLLAVVIILFIVAVWAFASRSETEYVTATVERTDLKQTVEAVGEVISEKDLELQFPIPGIVAGVYVSAGDHVRPGQRLAQVRPGSRGAVIASQAAALQSAQAALNALLEGTRPEEIAIADAEVENKRAFLFAAKSAFETAKLQEEESKRKLQALRSEASISLSGDVSTQLATIGQQLVIGDAALATIDDIFEHTVVRDNLERDRPFEWNSIRIMRRDAQAAIDAVRRFPLTMDFQQAITQLSQARAAMMSVAATLDRGFSILVSMPETSTYTPLVREQSQAKITPQRSATQGGIRALAAAIEQLHSVSANFETRIAVEEASIAAARGTVTRAESDILTYETQLRTQEAQLNLKKAGPRKTDIDAAAARVRQARADLARTQADFYETILVSPIDGTVTEVNVRTGEYSPAGAAIRLLGSVSYRIESFVSEIDVSLLQVTQSGSIELDAFPEVFYQVRVSEVAATPTDVDGIPKYRVKLDFVHPHDEFRIGMTGDVEIITGYRGDVLTIPRRAVIENNDGASIVRVLNEGNITEKEVQIGMEGEGGEVEILSGLEEGEEVILLEKK